MIIGRSYAKVKCITSGIHTSPNDGVTVADLAAAKLNVNTTKAGIFRALDSLDPNWAVAPPRPPAVPLPVASGDAGDVVARAVAYLTELPPSIQGANGSRSLLWAARVVRWGFALDEPTAISLLLAHFNPRCQPAWSYGEIKHAVDSATKSGFGKPRGWLLAEERPYQPARSFSRGGQGYNCRQPDTVRSTAPSTPLNLDLSDLAGPRVVSDSASLTSEVGQGRGFTVPVGVLPSDAPSVPPPPSIEVRHCPNAAAVPMVGKAGTDCEGAASVMSFRCRSWRCAGCRSFLSDRHIRRVHQAAYRFTQAASTGVRRLAVALIEPRERPAVVKSLTRRCAEFASVLTCVSALAPMENMEGGKTDTSDIGSVRPRVMLLAAVPSEAELPKGFEWIDPEGAVLIAHSALGHVPAEPPLGRSRLRPVAFSKGWDEAAEVQDTERPESLWEQAGRSVVMPQHEIRTALDMLGVSPAPAREADPTDSGPQSSLVWKSSELGGSLQNFIFLEAIQGSGSDGDKIPSVGHVVGTCRDWFPIVREVPDGSEVRRELRSRLPNRPTRDDIKAVFDAADRDRCIEEVRAEFRGAELPPGLFDHVPDPTHGRTNHAGCS